MSLILKQNPSIDQWSNDLIPSKRTREKHKNLLRIEKDQHICWGPKQKKR